MAIPVPTPSGDTYASRKRQAGPESPACKRGAHVDIRTAQRVRFAEPAAAYSASAGLGDLSRMSLASPTTMNLPIRARRTANAEGLHVQAHSRAAPAADDKEIRLSPNTVRDLFGPEPTSPSFTAAPTTTTMAPPTVYRPRRKTEAVSGFMPTTNDRYHNPHPKDAVLGSAKVAPAASPRIRYTADTERVRRASRTSSRPSGNVFASAAPSPSIPGRGRSMSRSAGDGAARSQSRSQSRGGGDRVSLYDKFATPGAYSPFFYSDSPSIMTSPAPNGGHTSRVMPPPPPPRPGMPRRSSISRRPSILSQPRAAR